MRLVVGAVVVGVAAAGAAFEYDDQGRQYVPASQKMFPFYEPSFMNCDEIDEHMLFREMLQSLKLPNGDICVGQHGTDAALQYSFAFLRTGPRPWSKMMQDNVMFDMCHNRHDGPCICVHGS